jgi:uncharacterized cupredoxin-like copper-binding protein
MKKIVLPLAAGFFGLATAAAGAATIVTVDLGSPADKPAYRMSLDKSSVKAGAIAFIVTNRSKAMVHEMIVVAVNDMSEKLPFDSKADTVVESKIKDLGEASDLDPGQKKTLTLDLKPGQYRLVCNQPGHHRQGMQADFTVVK